MKEFILPPNSEPNQAEQDQRLSPEVVSLLAKQAVGETDTSLLLTSQDRLHIPTLNLGEYYGLDPEVAEWSERKLPLAIAQWSKYNALLEQPFPEKIELLDTAIGFFSKRLEDLYITSENLKRYYSEIDDVDILLVPNHEFSRNKKDLTSWVNSMRALNGQSPDKVPKSLKKDIANGKSKIYPPKRLYTSDRISVREHIDGFVGNWSIKVIASQQTKTGKSVKQIYPDKTTSLGLVEWYAATLQLSQSNKYQAENLPESHIPTGDYALSLGTSYDTEKRRFQIELFPKTMQRENVGVREIRDSNVEL